MKTAKEVLKQKIQANAQRLRRFFKKSAFFRQNKIFKEYAKAFYLELGKKESEVNRATTHGKASERKLTKTHNENATWIKRQTDVNQNVESQKWEDITLDETVAAIK